MEQKSLRFTIRTGLLLGGLSVVPQNSCKAEHIDTILASFNHDYEMFTDFPDPIIIQNVHITDNVTSDFHIFITAVEQERD